MYQALLCLSLMVPGAEPCPCPGGTCVREPVVTKVPHPCYTYKCSEFCLPHQGCLAALLLHREPSCCDCYVHRKRELVKKVCVEERCEEKCVLKPGCAPCAPAVQSSSPRRPR
ncbi:MAG: hypothetical protein ACJ8F7_00040 [Gemmataceae bacterium]